MPMAYGQEMSWKTEDINDDGVKDSINIYYDGGSGFGGYHLEIISGKTKEFLAMDTYGGFCLSKQTILFPPVFLKPENKAFFERMKKELLGNFRTTADPILKWILEGQFSKKVYNDGDNGFVQSFEFKPLWLDSLTAPENYFLPLHSDTLRKIYRTDTETPEYFADDVLTGGVLMNRKILGDLPLEPTTATRTVEFFASSHSVAARRGTKYSYVFVTDYSLTGAPDKLRWPSISAIFPHGDYLVIRHARPAGGDDAFFVVNFVKGYCAELAYACSSQDNVEFNGSKFLLNGSPVLSADSLASGLDRLFED